MGFKSGFALALALALTGAVACSDDDEFDEIEADDECSDACDQWEDCVGEQFDVVQCRQRCFEAADDDRTDNDTIDACGDCLDDEDDGPQCAETCADVCADAFVSGGD